MAMSDLSFLHLVGPYPRDVGMYLLSFPYLTLGHVPWVWQCLIYFSCTLLGHTQGTSTYVCFTFLLCMITLCMMYVYVCVCIYTYIHIYIYIYMCVCLHVCGWLCTLYDGLSWLCEQPSLTTSTPDLVVWVCAQGICYRCIFMLCCVHNHRCVIVLIHVT